MSIENIENPPEANLTNPQIIAIIFDYYPKLYESEGL